MASIRGIEGMSDDQIVFEVQNGGRFVLFEYCISVVLMTFKQGSDVYFLRAGESAMSKAFPYIVLTLLAGWWGIPWGPIYTIGALITNFSGGKDVTAQIIGGAEQQAG